MDNDFSYSLLAIAFLFVLPIVAGVYLGLKSNKTPKRSELTGALRGLLDFIMLCGITAALVGGAVGGIFPTTGTKIFLFFGIVAAVVPWIIKVSLEEKKEQELIKEHNRKVAEEKAKREALSAELEAQRLERKAAEEEKEALRQKEKKKHSASFLAHLTDDNEKGWILKYQYERDLCLYGCNFDDLIGQEGEEITFRQEPENTYDPNAVAVYLDDKKVGYVFKGRTQDMTNDWLKRNLLVGGLINDVDESAKEATYRVAYYVPDSVAQSKIFPLIATSKKDFFGYRRSENMVYCKIGDDLVILEDYGTYTVYNVLGNELGELGAGFRNWADKITYDTIAGVVDDIYDDENGNTKMKVKIMLI